MKVSTGPKPHESERRTRAARQAASRKPEAMLILGPTGAGKSPLGDALEKHGLAGRRCLHFDFGANLREIARLRRRPPGFAAKDMSVIRDSLRTGVLLENENFPVAAKILERFRRKTRMAKDDLLILNGLPRHEGQAADLERTVRVTTVVYLDGSLDAIQERIRRDTGGDRIGRSDDSPADVERKYAIFRARTKPLLDYYRSRGVGVRKIPLGPNATAEDMLRSLAAAFGGAQ